MFLMLLDWSLFIDCLLDTWTESKCPQYGCRLPSRLQFSRILISSPPKKSVISQGHTLHSYPKVGNIYWSLCEWERYFVFLNIFSSMVFCSHDQNNQGITLITKQAKACHLFQSKQYFVCVIMLTQYCFLLSW